MALAITTFSNESGPSALFKALGHPLTAAATRALVEGAGRAGPVAVFDPLGQAGDVFALHPPTWRPAAYYVQRVEDLGRTLLDVPARPVSAIGETAARTILITAYDAARARAAIGHAMPAGASVVTLDEARLPDAMLSNRARYLDPINFATNFALFRDDDMARTRLVTANYWGGYGARDAALWLRLFDEDGTVLSTWEQPLGAADASVVIDSAEVRRRFRLAAFGGSLFLHAIRVRGHDTVKYALDVTLNEGGVVTSTHDANAFPADRYAGVPAPAEDESVHVWVQNCHPVPIPAGAVGLAVMGEDAARPWNEPVPPFGTRAIDVGAVLPGTRWPRQVEIVAGRHLVRPRYEVFRKRTCFVAHANVERTDLAHDARLAAAAPLLGRGYLLTAPVPPVETWRTAALPTPMATGQSALPLAVTLFDATGAEVARRPLGLLPRGHATLVEVDAMLAESGASLPSGSGHIELAYDPAFAGPMDGWHHALFRYERRADGHTADTSFGSHLFNLPITYRGEPQSYAGPPPGLTTRLFLRLGDRREAETFCHLIYPASGPWHARSATVLTLMAESGDEIARREVTIPRNGSLHWRAGDMFSPVELRRAGNGWVLVRDTTCRLFGYHGLLRHGGGFSLDHMFGF